MSELGGHDCKAAVELLRALIISSGTDYYDEDDSYHRGVSVTVGMLKRARRLIAKYDEREPEC